MASPFTGIDVSAICSLAPGTPALAGLVSQVTLEHVDVLALPATSRYDVIYSRDVFCTSMTSRA